MVYIIFLFSFVYFFFFLHSLKRIFEHTYIWQIKEYRWDRMKAYIRESDVLSFRSYETMVALVFSIFGVFILKFSGCKYLYIVIILAFAYYAYHSLSFLTSALLKKFQRPKKSFRNALIIIFTLVISLLPAILAFLFYNSIFKPDELRMEGGGAGLEAMLPYQVVEGGISVTFIPLETITILLYFVYLFGFDLFLPLIVAMGVAITAFFSGILREIKIKKAKKKISQIQDLKVVGITGSFGKSSTKEILRTILSPKFKTYATPGNVNTDIGVANTILNNLNYLVDVFIVEMGAYKRGEIKKICNIVKPDISVITAISDQHIALFGSLENILNTKYEIVENSKNDAVIVINADSPTALRIAGKSGKKEVLYSTSKQVDVWASDIKSKLDRLEFNVSTKEASQRFEVRALGEHNVSNILAATAVALNLGMNLEEIAENLKKGSERHQMGRLVIRKSKFGYRVLDDSYNSNAAGFEAALDYLDKIEADKKILVTIGIIELGERQEEVYKKLAEKIVKICDVLVTTNKKLADLVKAKNGKLVFDTGVDKQLKYLKHDVNKNDVVLFEGPNIRLIEEVVKR